MKSCNAAIPCPLCKDATVLEGQVRGYPLRRCSTCGHRYFSVDLGPQHIAKVYNDGYFFDGGDGYLDYSASRDVLLAQGCYYGRLLKRFVRPGRLIDVGAAAGFLTSGFRQEGWDAFGIEPNGRMVDFARQNVGVDVRVGSVESFEITTPVQAVAVVQVLAHFQDPIACLKKICSWLQPNGVLLVETWDSRQPYCKMARPPLASAVSAVSITSV